MLEVTCIVCEKIMRHYSSNEDETIREGECTGILNDGVICTSHGNYGSSIYDPMMSCQKLEFYLCDNCLIKKQKFINSIVRIEKRIYYKVEPLNLQKLDDYDVECAEEHSKKLLKDYSKIRKQRNESNNSIQD